MAARLQALKPHAIVFIREKGIGRKITKEISPLTPLVFKKDTFPNCPK